MSDQVGTPEDQFSHGSYILLDTTQGVSRVKINDQSLTTPSD